jgi:hypothetical protein
MPNRGENASKARQVNGTGRAPKTGIKAGMRGAEAERFPAKGPAYLSVEEFPEHFLCRRNVGKSSPNTMHIGGESLQSIRGHTDFGVECLLRLAGVASIVCLRRAAHLPPSNPMIRLVVHSATSASPSRGMKSMALAPKRQVTEAGNSSSGR